MTSGFEYDDVARTRSFRLLYNLNMMTTVFIGFSFSKAHHMQLFYFLLPIFCRFS